MTASPSLVTFARRRDFASAALAAALVVAAGVPVVAQTARYRLTVDTTWSEATHPGAFPPDAHLSWVAGGTHAAGVSFWSVGALASPGMVQMAETGVTLILEGEVAAAVAAGTADQVLAWHQWFCPQGTSNPSCGPGVVEFDVDAGHPRVTLVTMLGPSPDWFAGTNGLPLRQDGAWVDELVVPLHPFDAGTRDANAFALFGAHTVPPEPVSTITAASGQLVGPGSLGTFTFTRIDPFVDLGHALAGDHAPSLQGQGSLGPGGTFSVTATDLPPTYFVLFAGADAIDAPFRGGILVPEPSLSLLDVTGSGGFVIGGTLPPAVPSGATLHLQAWGPDPAAPAGACASNGLRLRIP